ncbi:hypothetical protein [Geomicrobium sp. JCM 19038]|uniref:hypothetical protein n=1 Tax=Geomicrobium sp. JCM 19038 TaxID=1460635 RepID=UPI0026A27697|nr:hypothetical protein [Geomicrobium sp. JCM 19038]
MNKAKQVCTFKDPLEVQGSQSLTSKPAKRVNIVTVKLARETSVLYEKRVISSPKEAYHLFYQFVHDAIVNISLFYASIQRTNLLALTSSTKEH